jgi:hypothetical protein
VSKDTDRAIIEAERMTVQVMLANVLRNTPFPTAEAIASHSARVARIETQLAALDEQLAQFAPKPAPLGTWTFNAGSTIVRDTSLGTRFERPEELPQDDSRHSNEYEPHLREFGEDIT